MVACRARAGRPVGLLVFARAGQGAAVGAQDVRMESSRVCLYRKRLVSFRFRW